MFLQVPAEYPLRPSLINLVDTGNPAGQEDLRTLSNEVSKPGMLVLYLVLQLGVAVFRPKSSIALTLSILLN